MLLPACCLNASTRTDHRSGSFSSKRKGTTAPRGALLAAFALLTVLAFPSTAWAQGFSFSEHGSCTMGRAGAAAAQTCGDGSAMFFNPAGLAGSQGTVLSGGVTVVAAQGDFTDDRTGRSTELQNDPIPVPHVYLGYGATDQLAFGLGLYVPYGLGTEWPAEDFEGRFLGYDNSLQSIYIQPTVAYETREGLSAGVGLTIVVGAVNLNQRLDLSEQPVPSDQVPPGTTFGQLGIPPGTDFADASLDAGGAVGIGGNFGVQYQATDRLRFGVRFTTPVTLSYEGDATFSPVTTGIELPADNPFGAPAGTPLGAVVAPAFDAGGPLEDQQVETELSMPAQFVAGVSFEATDRLTLLADYAWMGWSVFDRIRLEFENDVLDQELIQNYRDTNGFRLGAEYALTSAFTLRGGVLTHEAAAPDETVTPLLPEAYRNEFTAGFGWAPFSGVELNAAYQYIAQNDRRGRVHDLPAEGAPTSDINSGLYSFSAHLVGATLTVRL